MEKITLIEDFSSKVASLVSYDKFLWIGGQDGKLYMYTIESKARENDAPLFTATMLKKKVVSTTKKSIMNLQVDPPHKRLFALIDSTVSVFDMTTLTHLETLEDTRGATCYAINKNYSHELVAIVKKKMIVYDYRERMELVREMKVPGDNAVQDVEWMKKTICLGFKNKHTMLNYQTGELDDELQRLQLTNIVSDEYSMYGCFLKIIGPNSGIQWKENPQSISICFPFLLGISKNVIEVYNMYEKTFDEPIDNDNAKISCDNLQRVFIANKEIVHVLAPKPIDQQISDLIDKMRLLEAFGLFDKTFQGTKKEKEKKLFVYEQQAGFACFFRTRFNEAFSHFNKSRIDPREVLFYFKDLQEPQSQFIPTASKGDLREKIKNAMEQEGEDTSPIKIEVRIKNAKKALLEFLEKCRKMRIDEFSQDQLSAIDFALCKLYLTEFKKFGQLKTLLRSDNHIRVDSGEILFSQNARYLAFLYFSNKQHRKALETLKKLGEGKLKETSTTTNGVEETIEILSELEDEDLVLEFAQWAFETDETSSIQVFMSKRRKKRFNPQRVLNFLTNFPPDLQRVYLEYLIAAEKNEEERYHTKLILNYINALIILKPTKYLPFGVRLEAGRENGLLGEVRGRLIFMLEHTVIYNKYKVLSKLQKTQLHEETLVLYRKIQNHEEALKLLVFKIQDFEWAERYCVDCYKEIIQKRAFKEEQEIQVMLQNDKKEGNLTEHTNEPKEEKKPTKKLEILEEHNPLFLTLLKICLYPEAGFPKNEGFALHILKMHAKNIDPMKVLSLLPEDLLVGKIGDFLRQAMQASTDRLRNTMIIYNMSKIRHIHTKVAFAKGNSRRVVVGEDNCICPVCDKAIDATSVFVVLPDLSYVHFKCSNKNNINMHPTTGRNFVNLPVSFDDVSEANILHPPFIV